LYQSPGQADWRGNFSDSPKAACGGCSLDAPAGAAACQSAKNAGILGVFQVFGAKTGEKFTVKMPAAAIGTASIAIIRIGGIQLGKLPSRWVSTILMVAINPAGHRRPPLRPPPET
jgi:hypothetical protein